MFFAQFVVIYMKSAEFVCKSVTFIVQVMTCGWWKYWIFQYHKKKIQFYCKPWKIFQLGSVLRVMSSVILALEWALKFAVALKFDYWSISVDKTVVSSSVRDNLLETNLCEKKILRINLIAVWMTCRQFF